MEVETRNFVFRAKIQRIESALRAI